MDILDYIDKMQIMYGDKEPSSMVQEPRSNYSNGLSVDPIADSDLKIGQALGAYRRYRKRSGRRLKKDPVINFDKFFELYAEENFSEGGSAGQLVQPSDDGSRPGYNGRGGARPNTGGDRSEFIDYEARIKNPDKKKLDIAEKVHGNKPEYKGLKGFELWKKLKNFQRSNIIQESTTGKPSFKPKKNQLGKNDFIKLVSDNKGKTYNEFVEIIKKYKTKDGQPFTKQIIADRLRAYKLSGSFKREEAQGLDKTKKAAAEKKRKLNLKEVDRTKAKGVGNFQYHHVRQIAGGVPLTTDDVLIINKRVNAQIGGATNKTLNRISEAIRKNNKLALEAMNAKNEGLALEYMKRSDNLNAQAEKIVNSAIDKLPKKYKGYVGFNQFTLPRNEYGFPISNESMIIKKIGGMPVTKNAIDLTTLNLEQEAEFRKIVREQAEAGKTGPIKLTSKKANLLSQFCNRKKFQLAGSVQGLTCSMEEIQTNMKKQINEAAKVSKDGKIPKKFGKLRGFAKMFFGDIAIPLEYMFMAPDLAAGDVEGALRSSTAGLFGAGKVDLEKLPPGEGKKYIKHVNALTNFLNNYQSKLMAENRLEKLEIGDEGQTESTDQLAQAEKNMADIIKNYQSFGYTYAPGEKGLLEGKVAAQKLIRDKVTSDFDKKIDKGASTEFFKDSNKELLKENLRSLGGDPYKVTPINNLENYIKNKGEATAGNTNILFNRLPYTLEQAEAYGVPQIFDTYAGGFAGVETPGSMEDGQVDMGTKSVMDAYSSLPINMASQLAALEKKQFEEGMIKKDLQQRLAGGGIAGLSGGDPEGAMTKSMNPDSQGLRSLIKNGRKL